MATYWEISEDLKQVMAMKEAACDEHGEVTDEQAMKELDAWLEHLHNEEAAKLDSYAHLIQNLTAESASLKATADGFARAAEKRVKQVKWLISNIKRHLQEQGRTKAVSALGWGFVVCVNGGKQPVVIRPDTDPAKIDPRFLRITPEIDKDKVREALSAGEKLDFAELGERGTHLEIRAGV